MYEIRGDFLLGHLFFRAGAMIPLDFQGGTRSVASAIASAMWVEPFLSFVGTSYKGFNGTLSAQILRSFFANSPTRPWYNSVFMEQNLPVPIIGFVVLRLTATQIVFRLLRSATVRCLTRLQTTAKQRKLAVQAQRKLFVTLPDLVFHLLQGSTEIALAPLGFSIAIYSLNSASFVVFNRRWYSPLLFVCYGTLGSVMKNKIAPQFELTLLRHFLRQKGAFSRPILRFLARVSISPCLGVAQLSFFLGARSVLTPVKANELAIPGLSALLWFVCFNSLGHCLEVFCC